MTTVYIPQLIKSAEQAEALAPGTVAIPPGHQEDCSSKDAGPSSPSVRLGCYEPGYTWHSDWDGAHTGEEVVGWTALVPVEAEEETRTTHADVPSERRLVTPWEAAPGPADEAPALADCGDEE